MGSDDTKPRSTMSRNKGNSKVITGGRSIKHWPASRWPHAASTWPANPDADLNPPFLTERTLPTRSKTARVPKLHTSRTEYGQDDAAGPKKAGPNSTESGP